MIIRKTFVPPLARLGTVAALGTLAVGLSGCNNALEGGLTGAAGGALVGLGLGALTGDEGEGAAAGALIGGLGGAIIGDQNRRRDEYYGIDRGYYYGGGGGNYYYEGGGGYDRPQAQYYQPRYRGHDHYTPYCD